MHRILPVLMLAACADPRVAPSSTSTAPSDRPTPLADAASLPSLLRERALAHIGRHFAGGAIGRVVPIYRPDVSGPAYFAVEVVRDGASIGSMYLSTGRHDAPIVKWSEQPGLLVDKLADAARALGSEPARFEHVGIYDAAVDADGHAIISTQGDATRWAEYVRHATDVGSELFKDNAAAANAAWTRAEELDLLRIPVNIPVYTCNLPEAPLYNQMHPHDVGNGEGDFPSGCGATAWAMIIGWIDQQATTDAKWAPYRGLYREGGIQRADAFDAVAPKSFEWGPRRMTDQIRLALGSTGAYGVDGPDTWTSVYQMGYIGYYLAPLGLDKVLNWPTHHIGGASSDSLKGYAINSICTDHTPVILGIGNSEHYAVATAYNKDSAGNETFRLNMGWGGDIEWTWPSVFFVGTLAPNGAPAGVPYPNSGIEILEATYGDPGVAGQLDDAATSMTAACNTRFDCWYTVNAAALGNPAPGTAKPFEVHWRCGNDGGYWATLDAEANGKSVHLTCPTVDPQANCGRDPWGACTKAVHRAYKTPQHFYTNDYTEAQSWGFSLENGYYFFLDLDGGNNRTPFYRCYFPTLDRHFYTTDAGCEDPSAHNEGSLGYIATTQLAGTVPLYRTYNAATSDHMYTTDWNEANAPGYRYELVAGYVFPATSVHWDAPSPN